MPTTIPRPLSVLAALVAVSLALVGASRPTAAQCLNWRTFPPFEPPVNRTAYALAAFDDGSGPALYVGGTMLPSAILRWDGAELSSFGAPLQGLVRSLLVHDDGGGARLYAGGNFVVPGGTATSMVARWDGTGWQALGGNPIGQVDGLVTHDDGTGSALYAYGRFDAIGSVSATSIAKWDGSAWSALAIPGYVSSNRVQSAASFDDGSGPALVVRALVAASFWPASNGYGEWRNGAWSAIAPGPGGAITGMVAWDDGSGPALYTSSALRRWNGSAWQAVPGSTNFAHAAPTVLDVGAGPRLHVAHVPSSSSAAVRAWNGTTWSEFDDDRSEACSAPTVHALASFDDGSGTKLYAASTVGALSVGGTAFVRWNGNAWEAVGPEKTGVDGELLALRVHDFGSGPELYAAGSFCAGGGRGIARWDGARWRSFSAPPPSEVRALGSMDFGGVNNLLALYASGAQRWDGSNWHSVLFIEWAQARVMETHGSALWVGGSFPGCIARWSPTSLPPIGNGADGSVEALHAHDDGHLYVGGTFAIMSGVAASRIVRWDGASWSPVGSGMNGTLVGAFASFDDGGGSALYAGGVFTSAGGTPATNVARWNGTSWSALGAGLAGQVLVLGVYDDGSGPALHAGGTFTNVPGGPCHFARWNGTSWTRAGDGPGGAVRAFAAHDDGTGDGAELFVVGDFTHVGALPSDSVAAWRGCHDPIERFCFADGTVTACPCGNASTGARGCDNSASTGGARMYASGAAHDDTLRLHVANELSNAATLVFQGDVLLTGPVPFGDGLRCVGGNLVRLYTTNAVNGALAVPSAGDESIRARSAARGDPLAPGAIRGYQAWYRDANAGFCAPPQGAAWNLSNAVRVVW